MTDKQINEIAQELGSGLKCYVHIETKAVLLVPEDETADMEWWQESITELKKNFRRYVQIEKMDSHESFQMMENFIETVDNERLRETLDDAIRRPKPFRNFKYEIDNSGPYREKWFAFRDQHAFEAVKRQVEAKGL